MWISTWMLVWVLVLLTEQPLAALADGAVNMTNGAPATATAASERAIFPSTMNPPDAGAGQEVWRSAGCGAAQPKEDLRAPGWAAARAGWDAGPSVGIGPDDWARRPDGIATRRD